MRSKPIEAKYGYKWTEKKRARVRKMTEIALGIAQHYPTLADWCGTSRANVALWKANGIIPDKHVLAVSEATGVPETDLRPDLYRPRVNRVDEYKALLASNCTTSPRP